MRENTHWIGGIVTVVVWAAFGALLGWAVMGCTITTTNQGEAGIRYGTEITFFSRAAQTAPQSAVIETSVPSLEEWLLRDRKETDGSLGPPAKANP